MSEAVEIRSGVRTADDDLDEAGARTRDEQQRQRLPRGVEAYQIGGPLFFGAANRLDSLFDQFFEKPKVLVLRMRLVPVIDASGVHALRKLAQRCQREGIVLVLSGLQEQPNRVIAQMGLHGDAGDLHLAPDFDRAVQLAQSIAAARG